MPLSPFPITDFPGLDLRSEPDQQGGALDLLNVDFDRIGSIRSRPGLSKFNSASPPSGSPSMLVPWNANAQLLAQGGADVYAFNASGTLLATDSGQNLYSGAGLGTAAAGPYFYYATGGAIRRWTGSAFSAPGTMPSNARLLAVQHPDDRLVAAATPTNPSRLLFSDAGNPESFNTTSWTTTAAGNWVDLHPNDGESITALLSWANLLFAFKPSKFFVFYGNSTQGDGSAQFNYRTLDTGAGAVPISYGGVTPAACAANDGVYFVARDGLYRTTGGAPARVARALDPLFQSGQYTHPYFPLSIDTANPGASLTWIDGRLCYTYRPAALSTVYVFVSAPLDYETWTVWQFPVSSNAATVAGLATTTNGPTTMLLSDGGNSHIRKLDASVTTDDGTAITSRYRAGFMALNYIRRFRGHYVEVPSQEATVRRTTLDGQGSVNFSESRDFNVDIPTTGGGAETVVTMGTAPATKQGYYMIAQRGRRISWQVRDVNGGAWKLNSVTLHIRGATDPAMATSQDNT